MVHTAILSALEREVGEKYLADKPLSEHERNILKVTRYKLKKSWQQLLYDHALSQRIIQGEEVKTT